MATRRTAAWCISITIAVTGCSGGSAPTSRATSAAPAPSSQATIDIPACSALTLGEPAEVTGMDLVLGENYSDPTLGSSCTFNGNGRGGTQDHPDLRLEVSYIPVPASEHDDYLESVQTGAVEAAKSATSVIANGSLKGGEAATWTLSDSVSELVGANATPGSGQVQSSPGHTLQLSQLDGATLTLVVVVNKTTKHLPWQEKATAARSAQALLDWAASQN